MKKLKERLKRGLAMMMAAASIVSVLPSMPVSAASETAKITFAYCYDGAGNTIRYQQSVTHEGRNCGEAGDARTRIYADGEPAFCIQPGVSLHTGNTLRANASDTWNALSGSQRNAVNLALLYGSQGSMGSLPGSEDEKVVATQMVIWEIVTGCRNTNAPYNLTDSKFYNSICANGANGGVSAAYSQIVAGMQEHGTIPSFASTDRNAVVKELSWDGDKYVVKLTDTNGVLSKYNFTSSNSNVSVSASGNTLTITSQKAVTEDVLLSATKRSPAVSGTLVAYGDASLQDVVVGVESAADITVYLSVKIPYGHVQIVKTSEDGIVEGLRFRITGNGIDKTVVTGKNGKIKVENLNPGTYTVTELTEERYETQKAQKVTVAGGQTAKVEFSNILKRGDLKVVKGSEDNLVEGMRFHLYGTSLSGATVDEYAVTDKNGVAMFSNILISGSTPYTLEEVDTAVRYVIPKKQSVTIKWKEVTSATVTNILKKFRVNVTKTDKETGEPQGDATLAGAVYGIYDGDTLIDTYTTDSEGKFTTRYYICGDNWSVREITPSEGYLLDETVHYVGAEAKNYTVELNTTSNDVQEQVIKGRVSIIKHTDDGSTQIETPEEGAEFQVYLKRSGSFDNAKESERDVLVCNEYGYAETKDLPYGVYTVHQTKGWEGSELMKDFDVYVSRDGEVYRYLINNRPFASYIKIVKKDAETGNTIPLAGAGYQIYDGAGELVIMKYTYPEVTTLDTFYTGEDGYLITPEELPFGDYTMVEVQAPYGYVLDSTPIPFTVAQENSTEESGVTVVVTEQKNMPQKGRILVSKAAEEFAGVQTSGDGVIDKAGDLTEDGNIYTPVYEVTGKAGAVYEVVAAEDIVTQDGTVRASAGEVVDTITTDEDGNAETKELYLGKYRVAEVTAPYGCVLNIEAHEIELVYAGQEISVTETDTAFYNERQKVTVDLTKALEQEEAFGIGNKGEIQNVAFGLYAAEDLTASNGDVIPADGLIEIVFCNVDSMAFFTSDLPFGNYYVKEVCTDQHYILSDEKYPVEFSYQGQDAALVSIHVNDGEPIENELLRGRIEGIKVDTEDQPLEHAVIGLFSAGTEEFTEDTALLVSVTGKDGAFAFEDVPFGTYIVREIAAPTGYVLNEAMHYVSVTVDGEVIEITADYDNRYKFMQKVYRDLADYRDGKFSLISPIPAETETPALPEPEPEPEPVPGQGGEKAEPESLAKRLNELYKETDLRGYEANMEQGESEQETIAQIEKQLLNPDEVGAILDYLISVQQATEPDVAAYQELAGLIEEVQGLPAMHPPYDLQPETVVYIGMEKYEILSITDNMVVLHDLTYPLFTKDMPREEFDRKLRENPANDHLKVKRPLPEPPAENKNTNPLPTEGWQGTDSSNAGKEELPEKDLTAAQRNYRAVMELAPEVLRGETESKSFEAGQSFMPLTVESVGENRIAISHYYTQNGDSFADPDMEFVFDHEAKTLNARTFQQDNLNRFEQVVTDGVVDEALESELNDFASQWFKNIREQGYLPTREDKQLSESDVPIETEKENGAQADLAPAWEQKKPAGRIRGFDLHPEIPKEQRSQYRITNDELGYGTPKEKFRANIAAIQLLKKCEDEDRYATPDEQEILSKYVGWGGLYVPDDREQAEVYQPDHDVQKPGTHH